MGPSLANTDEAGILELFELFRTSSSMILIYPNAHLRLGPARLNVQAGISDRYVGLYNPISVHLSLNGFLKNKIPIQMGIINQFSEFPFETAGFFIQAGNPIGLTFLGGASGFSLALSHEFLK